MLTPLPSDKANGHLSYIGDIDWLFVADLDHKGLSSGTYSHVEESLKSRRALHSLTLDDDVPINSRNATYWYFSCGIEGRQATLAVDSWKDWHKKYIKHLRNVLSLFASAANAPQTLMIFVYEEDFERHLESILGIMLEKLPDSMDIIFVSENYDDVVANFVKKYDAKHFSLPLHHLLSGLHHFAYEKYNLQSQEVLFPSNTGTPISIDARDVAWLEEELELVHKNIGNSPLDIIENLKDYRKGKTVSWFDLALGLDIERDGYSSLAKKVRNVLSKRRVERLNLFHAPGAGGTTLAHRILWDFRKDYPCVVIQNCRDPKFTVERIVKIYSLTKQPVLIMTDGNKLSDAQSNVMSGLLTSRNIPATMLQVARIFNKPSPVSKNSTYIDHELSNSELSKIKFFLCRDVPSRSEAICQAGTVAQERTLFYLGLVAFGEEFISLNRYVEQYISMLSHNERTVIECLAIAHYYGQQAVNAQLFADFLGLPLKKIVELDTALSPSSLNLLVRDGTTNWRPLHYLISSKILEICLTPQGGDRRTWRMHLVRAASRFIDICSSGYGDFSNETNELVQSVFINRNGSEVTGAENAKRLFARIIEDVPNNEGKLSLFNNLTDAFPTEQHYWAHLGRFYSSQIKDYEKAISALDKALDINSEDHVVLHMKGMALRRQVSALIADDGCCDTIIEVAKNAGECFTKSRGIAPENEHGYIGEVQLLIEFLQYYGKRKDGNAVLAAAESQDEWVCECFGRAENLLMEVRIQKQGEDLSDYEATCRASLDILYGERGDALNIWQNLLDKKLSYAPPIRRQIVYTLLGRNSKNKNIAKIKDFKRCADLLQLNILEEPAVEQNLRLWLQAIRGLDTPPSLENIIEKVAYWGVVSNDINAVYYQYILYMLLVMNGAVVYLTNTDNALLKCQSQAKHRRNRTKSFEWLGTGTGIRQLVNQSVLAAR